jgi:hypothetical protein
MKHRLLVGLAIAAAVACGLPGAGRAAAAPPPRHCVVWIAPIDSSGHSKMSALHCFHDKSAARRFAHGPAPAHFAAATGAAETSSTTISIDYDSSGFSGTSLIWSVSNTAGCNGFTYSAASMPTGWNDRVSSSHSYSGCANNRHYHDTNFLGAGIDCTCSTMGTMSNETSSERWTS